MQSSRPRRVHSPQLKEAVVAKCRQPGASVSAVALAHGLNANLVRKWLIGRGLGRAGLAGSSAERSQLREVIAGATSTVARPMRFVPVALAGAERAAAAEPAPEAQTRIHIELKRGGAQLTVRWPSSQAGACAAWLSELAGALRR
jgi:transposase